MSDVIETGSLRKDKTPGKKKSRTKVMGKRSKVDRSKDELELGRFTGKAENETRPSKPEASDKIEVIGAKRRKVTSDEAKAERRQASIELQIGSTRDTSNDAKPSRKLARRRSPQKAKASGSWTSLFILMLLSALLVVASIAVFLLMPRYERVGDPLLTNPAFENDLADWTQQGQISWDQDDPARVSLEGTDLERLTFLARDIELPEGDSQLILRAQVRGDDVRPGSEVWDQARIYLAQISADGEGLWGEDHNLFLLDGTTEIRNYSRAFSIPEEIKTARLAIELKNSTGRLTVSGIELFEAKRPIAFVIVASCLLLVWSALILYVTVQTLRGIESVQIRWMLGITFALSVIGLMLPGYLYEDSWREFAYRFGLEDLDINTIAHGVMFAILALIVRLGRPNDPIWLHAGVWFLIGVASEVLQLFTIDREPSLGDLALDVVGILIGLALAELSQHMRRFRTA